MRPLMTINAQVTAASSSFDCSIDRFHHFDFDFDFVSSLPRLPLLGSTLDSLSQKVLQTGRLCQTRQELAPFETSSKLMAGQYELFKKNFALLKNVLIFAATKSA